MNTIVQIFDELLSSAASFIQLFNRKFFTYEEPSRRSTKKETNDEIYRKYYDLHLQDNRDGSRDDSETAFSEAITDARAVQQSTEVTDKRHPSFNWLPYPDKYEILSRADEAITAARKAVSRSIFSQYF